MLRRMTIRGKTLALVLTGGVVLASGGYALGSQAGGGSATAKDEPAPPAGLTVSGPPGPPGLDGLADRLGVTEDQLSDALQSLRSEQQPPDPDALIKELADALGVSQADLKAAMKKLRPRFDGPRGGKLCGPPGDGEGQSTHKEFRFDGGPGGPKPAPAPGGPGPRPGPGGPGGASFFFFGTGSGFAPDLAKELGIDKSKAENALKTFADKQEAAAKERRDAFAQKLADKLGISVDKVKEAMPEPAFEKRHP
jgi:hypothetical protein